MGSRSGADPTRFVASTIDAILIIAFFPVTRAVVSFRIQAWKSGLRRLWPRIFLKRWAGDRLSQRRLAADGDGKESV